MSTPSMNELRKLSNEFRDIASRTLRSTSDDARKNIQRLLAFVDAVPALASLVASAPPPDTDPMVALASARNSYRRLDLPIGKHEELGFIHALLLALVEDSTPDFWRLTYRYENVSNFNESVRAVLADTVGPYVTTLNRELEHLMIDHPDADKRNDRVLFHISGGNAQVNVAQDNARIVARQDVSAEIQSIVEAVQALNRVLSKEKTESVPRETVADLQELGEMTLEEVGKPNPRKMSLRMLHERFLTAASSLDGVQTLSGAAMVVADRIQQLL